MSGQMGAWGYNLKGASHSPTGLYENYIPSVLQRIAGQETTKLVRSHCVIDWYYQNKSVYKNRMDAAAEQGLTYIWDYYKTFGSQSPMGQQMPPDKERWIKWCVQLIQDMHSWGHKGKALISIGNEPNHPDWWKYAHDCIERIVAETDYDGPIIVPLNGAATVPGIAVTNPEYLTNVYEWIIWGHAYYWWWHLAYDWKTKKRNLNYPGTYEVTWNWLENRKLIELYQSTQPVLVQEFGPHYGVNADPQKPFANDLEWFKNVQPIFNKFSLDYCMEAIAPRRGGYDHPTWGRENSQTSPTNCNNAETPQSRSFLETLPEPGSPPPNGNGGNGGNGNYVTQEEFNAAIAQMNQRISGLEIVG